VVVTGQGSVSRSTLAASVALLTGRSKAGGYTIE